MKKVLIITYYWPPSGGPGVQRWLNFVKYLPQNGIQPIVYIPKNPTYPIVDKDLILELSSEIKIIEQPIFEPYRFAQKIGKTASDTISKGILPDKKNQSWKQKLLLWIRGNFFIPDARKFWVKPSVKFLSKYINEHAIDTVITTGPPHSLHLIGLKLKNKIKLQWIADFRDPWTTIGYHKQLKLSKKAKKKHIDFEYQVLNTCDKLIATSWGTQKEFQLKTQVPVTVITNGFEKIQLQGISLDSKFTISHIGSLLSERNPSNLWKALKELVDDNEAFASKFQLNLAGVVSETIIENIESAGLSTYVNLLGYVSHIKALRLQKQSQIVLLIEIDSEITKAIIPGKLFEYLQCGRPILGIGPKNADFFKIIKETQTGSFFEYSEKEAIKNQILNYFNQFQKNGLKIEAQGIDKYSRKSLTKDLVKLIRS